MKVVVVTEAAGIPQALATTAFIGALMEGFEDIGVRAKVLGLAHTSEHWMPESLGRCEYSAPLMNRGIPDCRDAPKAAAMGIFDVGKCDHGSQVSDWYPEWLLQEDLLRFAAGDEVVLMLYPRSYWAVNLLSRIGGRRGWKVFALATEALTDLQIDPNTREDYIDCVVSCADGLWSVSTHLADYWHSKRVPEDAILTHPPGVRASSFRHTQGEHDSHSAVYIGNLLHREVDYLLDISELVQNAVPDFRLSVYADAAEERRSQFRAKVARRGLSKTISLQEAVAPPAVPDVLSTAGALLLPRAAGQFSTAGFPNKLGEYLASGRPVVVTAVGDIPLYLRDGEHARVVPPDDCRAFADAVVDVLTDRKLSERLGINGQNLAARLARSDAVAQRILDFVDALPGGNAAPPHRTGTGRRIKRLLEACVTVERSKRLAVKLLRRVHLKPPAPDWET